MQLSNSFTDLGVASAINVPKGAAVDYALSGTFVATLIIKRSLNGGQTWETVLTLTAAASGTIEAGDSAIYAFECTAYTSGTAVCVLTDRAETLKEWQNRLGQVAVRITEVGIDALSVVNRAVQGLLIPAAIGKAGATSGWVPGAADNISLATLPASKTASTLVIPLTSLKVGHKILGFSILGQIESAGGAVTLDAELRKMTSAAADVVDATVASMTQLAVTADTLVSVANAMKDGLTETVDAGETFYLLITGTTAASTDIALQGIVVSVMDTSTINTSVTASVGQNYTPATAASNSVV